VLPETEPTVESALDSIASVESEPVAEAPAVDELTDTSFGRAVEEFAGNEIGDIVEAEAPAVEPIAEPTVEPVAPPAEPEPIELEEPVVELPEPEPVAEAPKAAEPPAQPMPWGANQMNFLGGVPIQLVDSAPPATASRS
jgi:hypothetical protein